jgi:uncharacterized protein DUF6498
VIVERLGHWFDAYRRTATTRTAVVLVVANAIPLIGVLFFGWSLITILIVYWIENGIVGFWNVPRIAMARGSIIPTIPELPRGTVEAASDSDAGADRAQARIRLLRERQASILSARGFGAGTMPGFGRVGLALFFLVHYGFFWIGHGVFVLIALPTFAGFAGVPGLCATDPFPVIESCGSTPFGEVVWPSVAIAAVALFLSHGASFVVNYLGRGEYLTASPTRQMGAPYGRVVVLHLTIIFGAFIVALIGAPIGALIVLVVLKTAFDLRLHLREHREAPGSA